MTTLAVPASSTEVSADTYDLLVRPAARGAVVRASRSSGTDPAVLTEHLLRARGRMPEGHPDRGRLRAWAIEVNLPLADRLARRYARRGERADDLAQVAALALVKAVDGFDPDRLGPFISYAVPTIVGALKRHFPDSAWGMRVPRSTQELLLDIPTATGDLTQLHCRTPTPVELADYLNVSVDDLLAAEKAWQVYRLPSLNTPLCSDDERGELGDLIGDIDPDYARVDERLSGESLRTLVAALPLRERRILTMRFYDEMTRHAYR